MKQTVWELQFVAALQVPASVKGDAGERDPSTADIPRYNLDQVLLRSDPRLDRDRCQLVRSGLMGDSLDKDAPAGVMGRIDRVDLERDRVAVERFELGAGIRSENDGVPRQLVVHGHDEGQAVVADDREAADRLT